MNILSLNHTLNRSLGQFSLAGNLLEHGLHILITELLLYILINSYDLT